MFRNKTIKFIILYNMSINDNFKFVYTYYSDCDIFELESMAD